MSNDVTVMSLVNDKYMATLPLKASRNEQRSVIHFLWAKRRCPNAIYSQMFPVYGDKCFTRPAIHVWYKKFAHGRESVVDEKDLADVLFQRLMQRSQQSHLSYGLTGMCQ